MRSLHGDGPSTERPHALATGVALLGGLALALSAAAAPSHPVPRRKAPARTRRDFARMELGRRLFFDPQVSRSGKRSCASCHAPEHGFSDPARISDDDFGATRRHSQTILDAAFNPSAHWDGEFPSVEALVVARLGTPTSSAGGGSYGGAPTTPSTPDRRRPFTGRPTPPRPAAPTTSGGLGAPAAPQGPAVDASTPQRRPLPVELRVPGGLREDVALRLKLAGRYDEGFRAAFGDEGVTLARMALAIGAYVRSIESTPAPFDRYRAGDRGALSAAARRGLALFEGRAGCNQCHVSAGELPLFTDYEFHNTGVAWDVDPQTLVEGSPAELTRRVLRRRFPKEQAFRDVLTPFLDGGRGARTQASREMRAFKTPTLRDVARRGPYMHDGRFDTLPEVVRYYAAGCGDDHAKDPRLAGFEASERDVADLVAFLESLSGEERPGLASKRWSRRAPYQRLQLLDAAGKPLARLPVTLVPAGDPIPDERAVADRVECVSSAGGWIEFKPGTRTHMRIVLPDELSLEGAGLVPDTCRKAVVKVPVTGRMTFVITFPSGAQPPATLVAEHRQVPVPKGHAMRRTRFTRGPLAELEHGVVARYEGWARSDGGGRLTLRIPGLDARSAPTYTIEAGAEIRLDLRD